MAQVSFFDCFSLKDEMLVLTVLVLTVRVWFNFRLMERSVVILSNGRMENISFYLL